MIAAASPSLFGRKSLPYQMLGLVAATLVAALVIHKEPEREFIPEMADRPVILLDGQQLFVQRYEVTIAEWNICFAQSACTLELRARQNQNPATTPATGLSYTDVQEYVAWINKVSDHPFRLPTAIEWDAMAAGVLHERQVPIFTDPALAWASSYLTEGRTPRDLRAQGSFSTSPEGVSDLDGSVWEWTQTCYAGSAEETDRARCPAFFVGGEHVAAIPYLTRDPANGGCAVGTPPAHLGMRLVTDDAV